MTLKEYLAHAGRQRFQWGGAVDCWTFSLNWAMECTGRDPLGEFRGAYATAREARRIVRRQGGTLPFAESLLFAAGFARTEAPAAGDVGLVWAPWKYHHGRTIFAHATGICLRPNLWAVKPFTGGLLAANFPLIRAWTLHG